MAKKKFIQPKSAAQLGATVPSDLPRQHIRSGSLIRMATGEYHSNSVAAMILVMSQWHGQGQAWFSVPYHMLYVNWLYRELGTWTKGKIPQKVPPKPPATAGAVILQDPDSVTEKDARHSLARAVNRLIEGGYVTVVREAGSDHLFPTDKMVEAIDRD